MKKHLMAVALFTSIAFAKNAFAEDSYKNCYGAANCMTTREYALEKIERKFRYIEDSDFGIPDDGYYMSLSDDGKEVTLYGPKEDGQSVTFGYRAFEVEGASCCDLFDEDETALKFEGNIRLEDDLGSFDSVVVPNGVSVEAGAFKTNNLTIGDEVLLSGYITSDACVPYEFFNFEAENWKDDYVQYLGQFSSETIANAKEWFKNNPPSEDDDIEFDGYWIPKEVKFFDGWDLDKVNIYCIGDIEKCKANMSVVGYEEGSYNISKAQLKNTNTEIKNADGSYTIVDKDGNILGYKGKRIYTIDEANQVSGKTNTFTIRYR